MSGHSKWANIRVRKTAQDKARGKIYTKHAKLIEIAAQKGSDPVTNSALRVAIDNAKANNVPNMNIERAIKKGMGGLKGEQMAEILYAAYLPLHSSERAKGGGPGGVACLIECLTDNRNRTISNIKMIINKNGGTFAESGSVVWMFRRRGVVVARSSKLAAQSFDELQLQLIDVGAEEIEMAGDVLSVTTGISHWMMVRDVLKGRGWTIESAGLQYEAMQKQAVTDAATARKLLQFVSALEEDDDVSAVHTNVEIGEEVMATAAL